MANADERVTLGNYRGFGCHEHRIVNFHEKKFRIYQFDSWEDARDDAAQAGKGVWICVRGHGTCRQIT